MADSELVKEWFKYADEYFFTAKKIFEEFYPQPFNIICYHCQQAAEKYIKGVSVYFDNEVVKTHDLLKLCDDISNKVDASSIVDACSALTPYGVHSRYPQEIAADEKTTQAALLDAQKVKVWAEQVIGAESLQNR